MCLKYHVYALSGILKNRMDKIFTALAFKKKTTKYVSAPSRPICVLYNKLPRKYSPDKTHNSLLDVYQKLQQLFLL